jgi:hypothetical protein
MATTSALSNYAEDELLDHMMGTGSWTSPTALWLQFHLGAPGEDGTGNVAAFTTRTDITSAFGTNATGRAIANDAQVQITGFTASETITHWSVHDANAAGNCLFIGDLTTQRDVGTGVTLTIAVGEIDLDFLDTDLCDYAANAALDHLVSLASMTSPTGLFVAHHTNDPGDNGTANVSAMTTANNRVSAGTFSASSGGTTDNDAAIQATGTATETISHVSLHDASTAGNAFWNMALDTPQGLASGETIELAAAALSFSLS